MDLIRLLFVPTSKKVLIVQLVHYFIFQDPGAIILQKRKVDTGSSRESVQNYCIFNPLI